MSNFCLLFLASFGLKARFGTKQSRRSDYDTPLFGAKPTGAKTLRCPEIQIRTLRKTKIRSTQIRTLKMPIH